MKVPQIMTRQATSRRAAKLLACATLAATVVGCASVPTQALSEARRAVQAARGAGAETLLPAQFDTLREAVRRAVQTMEGGQNDLARTQAEQVKADALALRELALLLEQAKQTVARTEPGTVAATESHALMRQVQAALDEGDLDRATRFARQLSRVP